MAKKKRKIPKDPDKMSTKQKLEFLKDQINEKGVLIKLGSEVEDIKIENTGLLSYDSIAGGEPRGRWTVDYGAPGAGKSTFNYWKIAQFQKKGLVCLVADVENSFDKKWAATQGVNLDELLIIEKQNTFEDYVEKIGEMVASYMVDFVLVDSIHGTAVKAELETKGGKERTINDDTTAALPRKLGQFLRIVNGRLGKSSCMITLIGQLRTDVNPYGGGLHLSGGHALKHAASVIRQWTMAKNELQPTAKIHGTEQKIGHTAKIKIEKTRLNGNLGQIFYVPFLFDVGVDYIGANVNAAIRNGYIEVNGSWYNWGDLKVQGSDAVLSHFRHNEEDYEKLMKSLEGSTDEEASEKED